MSIILHRSTHRAAHHLPEPIRARAVPPRQVLVPDRDRRPALDRLHLDRVLPPAGRARQLADVQLHPRRPRRRPRVRPRVMGLGRPQVVRGPY